MKTTVLLLVAAGLLLASLTVVSATPAIEGISLPDAVFQPIIE